MDERILKDNSKIAIDVEQEPGLRPSQKFYTFSLIGLDSTRSGFAEVSFDTFSSEADRMHIQELPSFIAEMIPVGARFGLINTFYPNGINETTDSRMRSGAGSALFEEITKCAQSEGAHYIVGGSASPTAQQFLKKKGFSLIGDYWFVQKIS